MKKSTIAHIKDNLENITTPGVECIVWCEPNLFIAKVRLYGLI